VFGKVFGLEFGGDPGLGGKFFLELAGCPSAVTRNGIGLVFVEQPIFVVRKDFVGVATPKVSASNRNRTLNFRVFV
jgi:hypothetical protein